ncbi:MAG: CDP-diacylglycerol--glycerol-3-phosphate 3-phosphatidyltransferase [Oscillospiraceae bacterium]|nr:CDP-diacylglycerol--glycerol-3-phosphate 3-phosphatidyltransferase [Oscillospiraceae bacterium]
MNIPNRLTLLRVFLVPVYVLFFYWEIPAHYLIVTIVFVAASITDAIDGHYARKHHLVTDFGKFLDPLADKILVVTALSCFLQQQKLNIIIFLLIVSREFMVSALRLVVAGKGTVVPAGFTGKLKTAFTMTALIANMVYLSFCLDFQMFHLAIPTMALTVIEIILNALFWISAGLTLWSGGEYLIHYWKDIDPTK